MENTTTGEGGEKSISATKVSWKDNLKDYKQSAGSGSVTKYGWLSEIKNKYDAFKLPRISKVGIYHNGQYCRGFSVTYDDGTFH
jgi:hypothetical protein